VEVVSAANGPGTGDTKTSWQQIQFPAGITTNLHFLSLCFCNNIVTFPTIPFEFLYLQMHAYNVDSAKDK